MAPTLDWNKQLLWCGPGFGRSPTWGGQLNRLPMAFTCWRGICNYSQTAFVDALVRQVARVTSWGQGPTSVQIDMGLQVSRFLIMIPDRASPRLDNIL